MRKENQDIKSYTPFHTARLIDKGRIVGTCSNNRGDSGDYELVFVKE